MLLTCLWAMSNYEHALRSADGRTWMGGSLQKRAVQCSWLFMASYQWLSGHYAENFLFRIRPKFHYFAHIHAMMVQFGFNPAAACCLDAESFNGLVKQLAKCTHAKTTGLRSLQRYIDYLHVRWKLRADGISEELPADCLDLILRGS